MGGPFGVEIQGQERAFNPFETGRWFTPRVDRFAQATVRTNKYTVRRPCGTSR
ncbi:hypothetical protein GCM10009556_033100 [Acrocarpospora pleiomorpha]